MSKPYAYKYTDHYSTPMNIAPAPVVPVEDSTAIVKRYTWRVAAAILGLDNEDHEYDPEVETVAEALEMYYERRKGLEDQI
jgi:hypothetical protein